MVEVIEPSHCVQCKFVTITCFSLWIAFVPIACHDDRTPPTLKSYSYKNDPATVRCQAGTGEGRKGVIDGEVTPDGIRYNVRTPSNYDATVAHPLLMVYAPVGHDRWMSERFTGLTPSATGAGFVVVYADHRPLGVRAIEQLGRIPEFVAREWCIDKKRLYATGHSDGGTVSLALALLDRIKQLPSAIAPSAAGWTGKDLRAHQCRTPIPVMIMHSSNDSLFPGWGTQTAAWWAACNRCDVAKKKIIEEGCLVYQQCASGGATLYCEGTGTHREWPGLNRLMLDFLTHSERFR